MVTRGAVVEIGVNHFLAALDPRDGMVGGYTPHCNRMSAERVDSKGVADRPLRKRARKMKKRKEINRRGRKLKV